MDFVENKIPISICFKLLMVEELTIKKSTTFVSAVVIHIRTFIFSFRYLMISRQLFLINTKISNKPTICFIEDNQKCNIY